MGDRSRQPGCPTSLIEIVTLEPILKYRATDVLAYFNYPAPAADPPKQ